MVAEVQRWPSVKTLEDLKDCLDFCNAAWLALFCQLGGIQVLLQVLQASEWLCSPTSCDLAVQAVVHGNTPCKEYIHAGWTRCADVAALEGVCRRGLQALDAHRAACEGGAPEAGEAVVAALRCLHALMSKAEGITALMQAPAAAGALLAALGPAAPEAARLVLDMLTKLQLFSCRGYRMAVQVGNPLLACTA